MYRISNGVSVLRSDGQTARWPTDLATETVPSYYISVYISDDDGTVDYSRRRRSSSPLRHMEINLVMKQKKKI